MSARALLAGFVLALAAWAPPAAAQVNFSIGVDIGPPPARIEVVPPLRAGFIWAPGYWAWDDGRHVWIAGRWIESRPGYYWAPERWDRHAEEDGHHWHFEPGHWEREHGHWDHDRGRGRGRGEDHDDRGRR